MAKKSKRLETLQKARKVLKRHYQRLMRRKGIQGCDVGFRVNKDGNLSRTIVIRIHVQEKILSDVLDSRRMLPEKIEGIPVQVLERKYRQALASDRSKLFRDPILGGVAIAPENDPGAFGTLGVVVFDRPSRNPRYLTNAHVVPRASTIIQPSDISTVPEGESATIGVTVRRQVSNFVDCALIEPSGRGFNLDLIGIKGPFTVGTLTDEDLLARTSLVKSGAKTKMTRGVVDNIDARVDIPRGGTFLNQITVRGRDGEAFLRPGDSGSCLIREGTKEIVGLLHASTEEGIGVACHFERVMRTMDIVLQP